MIKIPTEMGEHSYKFTELSVKRKKRTEQNMHLFKHLAYIAHSPNPNTAWKRKENIKSIIS